MNREEKLQLILDKFSEHGIVRKGATELWVGDEKMSEDEIDILLTLIHTSKTFVKRQEWEKLERKE